MQTIFACDKEISRSGKSRPGVSFGGPVGVVEGRVHAKFEAWIRRWSGDTVIGGCHCH